MSRFYVVLKLAFKNILMNWRHSLATMLAIMMGFAAVSIFDGFIQNMKNQVVDSYIHEGMLGHVVVQKKGCVKHYFEDMWTYTLNEADQNFINQFLKSDARVEYAARFLITTGLIANGSANGVFVNSSYDVQEGLKIRGDHWAWNTIAGKPLHEAKPNSVLLGVELAKKLNCEQKGPLVNQIAFNLKKEETPFACSNPTVQLSATTEMAQVNATHLNPVGVIDLQLRDLNRRFIMMPLEAGQSLYDTKNVTRYSILLKDEALSDSFIKDFEQSSKDNNKDFEFIKWFDHPSAAVAKGGMEILNVFKFLFLSVVAIISAMSVANSMMKSINERVREIGMLRSIGFKSRDMIRLFSLEGLFMGLFSCIMGLFFTITIAFIINHLDLSFKAGLLSTPMPLGIAMSIPTWIASSVVLCVVSFFSSFFVSRQFAKMNISETLRYVA